MMKTKTLLTSECDKFGDEFNGTITYSPETPSEGSTAEFSCPNGGNLLGTRTALCQHDGTWNISHTPECAPGRIEMC